MHPDPYVDADTGILKNLLGAKTSKRLAALEAQVVFANELEINEVNIPRTNDLNEVLKIHEQLFKGVFEWAGSVRTVDIKKNSENSEFFLPKSKIFDASVFVFNELAKENWLRGGVSHSNFVERLAHHYDQFNYIHPFREGNGRVQRIFWSRVAADAGYEIDWSAIVGDENDEASRIGAEDMDLSALIRMFDRIVHALEDE